MAEKTEKATPKKLRDARKKGQVAKSQDFPSAVTFIVSIGITFSLLSFMFKKIGAFMIGILKNAPSLDAQAAAGYYMQMISLILQTTLPILVVVASVGVLVTFLVIGPVFSVEVFKPNFKKFNPVENLKQKFKLKTFIELLKSLLKLTGAAILIYLAMRTELENLIATVMLSPIVSAVVFEKLLIKVVIWIGIYFILIAIFDLSYQKYQFSKDMKMEKFEVKQEYKDTEGNPEIKSKRRQIAQEIAYDEGTNQVRRAKAIVTNPTDIAVALGYEPQTYEAPWIIDMGTENKASVMIQLAQKYNIPIMRNVPLAHKLLDDGKINEFIPEDTYEAVSEILLYLESLKLEGGS